VLSDGGLVCLGMNTMGQLGTGNTNDSYIATSVVGLTSGETYVTH
jgi:hypothetical protein